MVEWAMEAGQRDYPRVHRMGPIAALVTLRLGDASGSEACLHFADGNGKAPIGWTFGEQHGGPPDATGDALTIRVLDTDPYRAKIARSEDDDGDPAAMDG
jgi:hypothetical protein